MARRPGQIIERGDGVYLVRVYLGTDEKGKRIYSNKTVHGTLKDAQAYLNNILHERDLGIAVRPSRMLFSENAREWLDSVVALKVEPETLDNYRNIFRLYINPYLGYRKLCDIRPIEIQRLYGNLLRLVSPRTVILAHTMIKASLRQAVIWGRLVSNPADLVEPPKREYHEMKTMDFEQARIFLEYAKADPLYPMFLVSLTTGVRPGEVLAMKWSDFDLDAGTVSIRRAVTRKKRYKDPKTAKGRRLIRLAPSVTQVLREYKAKQMDRCRATGKRFQQSGLAFVQENGRPWGERNVARHHFKQILRKAGLPDLRWYDLRHTCATLLLLDGEHPKVVADLLGDASVETVLDTYSHVLPVLHEKAALRMETRLFGNTAN